MIAGIIIAVSIIILDQVTKYFLYGITTSLIGDFLWLPEKTENSIISTIV